MAKMGDGGESKGARGFVTSVKYDPQTCTTSAWTQLILNPPKNHRDPVPSPRLRHGSLGRDRMSSWRSKIAKRGASFPDVMTGNAGYHEDLRAYAGLCQL